MSSTSTTVEESTPPDVVPDPRPAGWLLRLPLAEILTYVVAILTTSVGTVWALGLRHARLDVPFTYWGDAVATSAHVKTTLMTGWYEHQPLLGAPAGQTFHDFPTADNLHLVVVRILGLFTDDWPTVLNLYYLLGFPLAAVAAVYTLRQLGARRASSVVAATLFALAPYHFLRGEAHLWLASYYVIPLAVLVVVRIFQGEPVWGPHEGDRNPRRWVRPTVTALACVTVATASTYYAVFTVVLVAVSGVAALAAHRSVRRFVGAVGVGALTAVVAFLNMLPDSLWSMQHGRDLGALVRNSADAEIYSLKLTALLLPVENHVVGHLAELRMRYDEQYPLVSERPALGLVAAVGLLCLLVIAIVELARRTGRAADLGSRWPRLVALSALVLVALLFSTAGGFSSLISLVTPDLRGWNRMSIVIAMLALTAVALIMDQVADWLRSRTTRPVTYGAVALVSVVLLVGGTVDQVGRNSQPDHAATAVAFEADARWVADIEQAVGADASILQLPYIAFPESSLNGVIDTDQLKPFLHSDTLRWSGGGIKGRAASDWSSLVSELEPAQAGREGAAAGFDAVLLDRAALGPDADAVTDAWTKFAGPPIVTGPSSRHLLFDLRPARAELLRTSTAESVQAAGFAVTHPTMSYPDEDVVVSGPADTVVWTASHDDTVTVVVDNASDSAARVTLSFTVTQAQGPVAVTAPWGERTAGAGQTVRWTADVPAGQSTVTLHTPTRAVALQITAPLITPRTAPLDLLVAR